MSETISLPKEDYQALLDRIQGLEERLKEMEQIEEDEDQDEETLSDSASKLFKDTRNFMTNFLNASAVAFKETSHIFSDLSEASDREKLDEISAGMVGIFRKSIDIQKKVLDKFIEDYEKED